MHVISNYTRAAAQEVFTKMLNLPLVFRENSGDQTPSPIHLNGVIGSVSFTGKMTGVLYLCMSEALANLAASRVVGSQSYRPEDVDDVIGELTNMVAGNLKSKMTDRGFAAVLNIPTILRGSQIRVASLQASLILSVLFDVPDAQEALSLYVFARLEE